MLSQISKVLLLVALLTALAASSVLAFGDKGCNCFSDHRHGGAGGCQFDKKTSQCINTGCKTICF